MSIQYRTCKNRPNGTLDVQRRDGPTATWRSIGHVEFREAHRDWIACAGRKDLGHCPTRRAAVEMVKYFSC